MWSKIKETIQSTQFKSLQKSEDAEYVDREPVYLSTPDGRGTAKLRRRRRPVLDQERDLKGLIDRIFADGHITLQDYITLTRRVGESNQKKNTNLIQKLSELLDAFSDEKKARALAEVKLAMQDEHMVSPPNAARGKKEWRTSMLPSKHAVWVVRKTNESRGPSTSSSSKINLGGGWRELSDGENLETAYQKEFHGMVYIESGRYTVDMKRRVVTPTFWNDQPLEVRRATWFFTLKNKDNERDEEEKKKRRFCSRTTQLFTSTAPLFPYSEDEAARLEQILRRHGDRYEDSMKVSLPILDYVRGIRVEASSSSSSFSSSFHCDEEKEEENIEKTKKEEEEEEDDRRSSSIGTLVQSLLTTTTTTTKNETDFNSIASNPKDLEASSWIRTAWNPLASYPRTLCRGLPLQSKSLPRPSKRCVHLVLVVHGIGEEYCRKVQMTTNCDSATTMRRECAKCFAQIDSERARKEYVEVLPIDWSDALHGTPHLLQTLNQVTMKNLVRIRNLARYLMSDVMHFMEPHVRHIIFDTVVRRMNRIVQKVRQIHGHDMPISIFAHSLGSIISFDILSHQFNSDVEEKEKDEEEKEEEEKENKVIVPRLCFHPVNFFACGSPIGFFVSIRKQAIGRNWKLPTCGSMFNIFHPRDPFAHRVEPLIDLNLGDLPPARIKSVSGVSPYHIVASDAVNLFFGAAKRVTASKSSLLSSEESKKRFGILNNGSRVDYAIQESTAEAAMEYVAALTSHSTYWSHPDVVHFWVSQVLLGKKDANK